MWRTWAVGPQLVVTCNMRDGGSQPATCVMHLKEQAAAGGHKLLLQKDQKTYLIQRKPVHSTRKGYIPRKCIQAERSGCL